ncbi:unnamed protein product, partial [Meganyctiphanes norvegica]
MGSHPVFSDGMGTTEVWRIRNDDLIPVSIKEHGEFFMGDCYIVKYTYVIEDTKHYLLFYWIGSDSSIGEAGTAARKTVEIHRQLQGNTNQVRVEQGKEPSHFMAIFGGRIILYKGGFASTFDGPDGRDEGRKRAYMLQVRGTPDRNIKATEVDLRAGCLNSNDCFIVVLWSTLYVWYGEGSSRHEQSVSSSIAARRGRPIFVIEGRENESFWEALGGKEDYANSRLLKTEGAHPQRLFHCSNATGVFRTEEIENFTQQDLVDDDVMLLDTWDAIFVWVGNNSNKVEQKASEQFAFDYLEANSSDRPKNVPVIKIKQSYEPLNFTGFFGAWDNDLWNNDMTYADLCAKLRELNPGVELVAKPAELSEDATFPLGVLQTSCPEGVDPATKEMYLSAADFKSVFGKNKEEFSVLPKWKKDMMKKKAE